MRLDRCIFRLDGRDVTLGDVLAASRIGGRLADLRQAVELRLACAALAGKEGIEVPDGELQDAVDRWRQERDLIAAEDVEAWFSDYGLDLDGLSEFCEAKLLGERMADRGEEALRLARPDRVRIEGSLSAAAVYDGLADALAQAFALRAVAPPAADAAAAAAERGATLLGSDIAGDAGLAEVAACFGVSPERAEWLLDREAAYRICGRNLADDAAVGRELRRRHSELVRVEMGTASFVSEAAAREAICCAREDGEPLEQVAGRAGGAWRREAWFAEELQGMALGPRLAASRPGDLIGPTRAGEQFEVVQVFGRREPDLSDPVVRARLERALIERTLEAETARRIRFPAAMKGRGA